MSTTVAPVGGFTDEQRDFQAAIADFCERELGTKEQREAATHGYTELHNQEIYEKLADLGWLGVSIDESYGGSGGGIVDACIFLEGTMRGLAPIAGYGVSLIVAGAYERFGSEDRLTQAVTVFALLEMYRKGEATWEQPRPFGPILIRPVEPVEATP